MPTLNSFTNITLDGFFAGPRGELDWAHRPDAEFQSFVQENAKGGGRLLFGRVTYELMASYWPTPFAAQNDPVVAGQMNAMPKFVASKTLGTPAWQNTTLLAGDLVSEVRRLKQEQGDNITILGSGSLVTQLAAAGLIDQFQIVVNPILLGAGKKLFDGLEKSLNLTLSSSRAFGNGCVLLNYVP